MSVLIKGFIRSIVGVLTVGLLGCGCFFSSPLATPHNQSPSRDLYNPNPYLDLSKAWELQYKGEYKKAIAKYEQALKKLPRFPDETKVINVNFPAFLKYQIAFCYTKLAEAEGDVALYSKAEAAAQESYQTAIVASDQADALYFWGYILFKQARYEEARAKFEALLETLQQNEDDDDFTLDALFGLGKVYLGLGDETAAQRVLAQLEARLERMEGFHTDQPFYGLGKIYLQLGDETAAQRIFAQLEARLETTLQEYGTHFHGVIFYEQTLYELGKIYLGLGNTAAAQSAFAQLFKHFPDSSYRAEVQRLLQQP